MAERLEVRLSGNLTFDQLPGSHDLAIMVFVVVGLDGSSFAVDVSASVLEMLWMALELVDWQLLAQEFVVVFAGHALFIQVLIFIL